jgi:hypothetical protein
VVRIRLSKIKQLRFRPFLIAYIMQNSIHFVLVHRTIARRS